MSGATAVSGGLEFPAGSVEMAVSVSPLVCGGLMVMVNEPSGPATPLPMGIFLLSVITTVLPGSVFPVTTAPSAETLRSSGADGGRVSILMLNAVDTPRYPTGWLR